MQKLGKYEILGQIGKGGFATVYRARDPDLDREVALKVLPPLLMRDPEWVDRFHREARAVARLDHPHIVTIYEVGEAEGLLYIAMRLVADGSLAQRIAEVGPLPWEEAVQLVQQIASALDFAHEHGVIHRDLKTANVLLDSERGAQLTDFGFARMVSESTYSTSVSGGVVGTPHYIAPEVWEGRPATAQTDVYALGCILYEMVMGERLFQGDTTPAVMRAHFQPLEMPETWPEGVPPGLGEVLHTALAKEPESRYARAGELAEALAALKADELAEPYAELERAVAAEAWEKATELAGKIRARDPDYRDVAALEETALDGLELAARRREAATRREEAERALAEHDLRGAGMAARQWQSLMPDDVEAEAFLARLRVEEERAPFHEAIREGMQAAARKKEELEKGLEAQKATTRVEPAPVARAKPPFFATPAGIGIIVVLVIACVCGLLIAQSVFGPQATPPPAETPELTAEPASTPAAPPSSEPSAPSEEPAMGTTYTIGFASAMTGAGSFLGWPQRNVAEIIQARLDEAGGVTGPDGVIHEIEIIIGDTESNPDVAASLARRYIDEDEVVALVMGSVTPISLAISAVAQEAEVPYVSMASYGTIVKNPETGETYHWVFKSPQGNLEVARWQVERLTAMSAEKVCYMYENTGYGKDCYNNSTGQLTAAGFEEVFAGTFERTDTTFPQVPGIEAAGCDLVIIGAIPPGAANAHVAIRTALPDLPIIQGHGVCTDDFITFGGESINGAEMPCSAVIIAEDAPADHPQKEVFMDFKSAYEDYTGEPVSTFGGHAWDALYWVIEALETLPPEGLSLAEQRTAIRDYIETNIVDWPGTAGVFNISANDHCGLDYKSMSWFTVKNGRFVPLPQEAW